MDPHEETQLHTRKKGSKNQNEKVKPYIPLPNAGKEGLGYDRNNSQPQNKEWTLKEHFVSHSIFNPNESPDTDDPFQCVNFGYNADLDDENRSEEAIDDLLDGVEKLFH